MRNLQRLFVGSGALLFLGVSVATAFAFNGPPPGNPPDGSGSIFTDAANRVGIGDATPDAMLDIASATASTMFRVDDSGDGDTTPFLINGSGNVGVGTESPGYKLDIQGGDVNVSGVYRKAGLAGIAATCAAGQALTGFAASGGLVVGGICTTPGDITDVTAGTGLTGGGATGAVTLNLATPVAATNGGTAQSTYATGDLLYSSAANTLAKRAIGSAGQVLMVSGGVPVWAATSTAIKSLNAQTGATQTFANDTNVTVSSSANTHTFGWSGTLAIARGGTGASTASGARTNLGAAASGANTDITSLSGLTTPLSATQGGTAQSTYATGDLIYASGANTLAKRTIGSAGQVLTVSAGVPTWTTASGGTVTSVNGSGGTTGLTLTGGPITTTGTLTIGGTLAVANGGTGATTAAGARTNLGAAASGANSDITSLSGLTTPLSVAQGGTGAGTLPANSALMGNDTGAVQSVAPGAYGNVLTSDGTAWVSQSASGTPLSYEIKTVGGAAGDTTPVATCSAGKRVVGGGCSTTAAGANSYCRLGLSRPNTSTSWQCRFYVDGSSSYCGYTTAYAICM
ncbi:MAG: hypothetical protein HYW56_01165 [Candidatus Harrisonbacteria bacterium]|nr:hypothetical protein [Candidatus Harrisonbacteria bacterium]